MERELNNFKQLALSLHRETADSYIFTAIVAEDINPIKSYYNTLKYLEGLTVDNLDINDLSECFDDLVGKSERINTSRNSISTLVKCEYELRKAFEDAEKEI